jgi:predicted TIM-barrel fold metal-dependent hydrolase
MAEWLNGWMKAWAAGVPDAAPTATFFPEPSASRYVAEALDDGARVVKVHLEVGAFDPRDPLLDDAWGRCAAAGVPIVVHCGSGPTPGPFTGPGPIGEVLARHPSLRVVVAHLGSPEYADFVELAERYPGVMLDTTMAGTDFTERVTPLPPALRPRLHALATAGKVVFGSDFPNIPYPYEHQLAVLPRLGLDTPEALAATVWHTPMSLLS